MPLQMLIAQQTSHTCPVAPGLSTADDGIAQLPTVALLLLSLKRLRLPLAVTACWQALHKESSKYTVKFKACCFWQPIILSEHHPMHNANAQV